MGSDGPGHARLTELTTTRGAVAARVVAWLSLRDRLVSRWLGLVSLIPPVAVLFMSGVLSIAGFPGIVGPIWLIVAFAGLSLGRHGILGTAKA
ncbi:hypothetical protein AB1484_19640 [Parafrankia sp. FMc6]|uniref:hypothetical protein n=1 Tax=Parafrankia soli TaxID=2599596 RepID=UPI0034D3BD41